MIRETYEEPDEQRRSTHDEERQIRTRWFGGEGVEGVVYMVDGRIVTVWRTGRKP